MGGKKTLHGEWRLQQQQQQRRGGNSSFAPISDHLEVVHTEEGGAKLAMSCFLCLSCVRKMPTTVKYKYTEVLCSAVVIDHVSTPHACMLTKKAYFPHLK